MMDLTSILPTAVFLVDLALLGSLVIFAGKKAGYELNLIESFDEIISENTTKIVFLFASVATLGSLYYSNIVGYEPCRLCWFQRIFMYPISIISGTALFLDKNDVKDYVMPLALIGLPISLYHFMIQRFEQFTSAGCSITAVSCSTEYTFYYGYITIPVMAFTAFLVIILVYWRYE